MKPGLYSGMPMNEYHKAEGVSQSSLKYLRDKTPAHLKVAMETEKPPTPAMVLGSAIHDAVLLPEVFDVCWHRGPDSDKRTKAGKRAWEDAEAHGASILKPADYDLVINVRDAIANHKYARQLLIGQPEQSAFWIDEETGVLCKGRFDLIGERTRTLVDLKTTKDASKESFTRDIFKYGYYLQGSHYLKGAAALGLPIEHFAIIAVEKTEPFGVAIYRLTDDAIVAGEDELRPLMQLYAECKEFDAWHCYPEMVQDISLPHWAWNQIEERIK